MAAPQDPLKDPPDDTPVQRAGASNPLRTRVLEHDLLRVFVAVVDYGGYTSAAQFLHRTQAAVSQQIKRLEESAQTALFQHPRRTVQLTEQGQTLLAYARRLIALNDEALGSLKSDEVGGRVRIGANNYDATSVLPPLLARFCSQHPEVQIEMHTAVAADMQKKLGSVFDLTINIHPEGSGGGVLLRREACHWYTSATDSPHARDPLPLALLPSGSLYRTWAIESLAEVGRAWHLAQESSNLGALKACVAAGLAVTVFQKSSVGNDPALRVLTPAEGFAALPEAEVRLETAERYLPRAAVRLHEFLMAELAAR